jgi:O-antigen/teichoic acid export membrane protein
MLSAMQSAFADASSHSIGKKLCNLHKYAFALLAREHILSFADQALVSGTSFLTTLFVARFSNAGELGVFAVGISLLVSLLSFQDSLILQPYAIQRHFTKRASINHKGASLVLSGLFSMATISLIVLIGIFLLWNGETTTALMTFAIAAALPFVLTREFARRVAIAHLEMERAVLIDFVVSVSQLASLAWLGWTGRMSAIAACAALGGASALGAAGWLYYARSELGVQIRHVPVIFKQTWNLGKWLAVGRMTVQVQNYVTYWITIILAGAAVTGVYAACMSIVNIANPVMFAISNVMAAKLALAWKSGGGPALWHDAVRHAVLISAAMSAFTLAIALGGEQVMHLLYPGNEYAGHAHILTVLMLATFAAALNMPASFGLATIERPRAIVLVGVIGAVLTVILVSVLLVKWGLLGAAYGLLAGNVIGGVGRWSAFHVLVPAESDSMLIFRALESFTPGLGPDDWNIARIGSGEQSTVFAVEGKSSRAAPGGTKFVLKLYKPEALLTLERIQAQFKSMSELHAALHSQHFNGWTVLVPRPIHICKSPLAFIMTIVPGKDIDGYRSDDHGSKSELLNTAAQAFAGAMEQYWASGKRHGDLGLRNVLFDVDAKTISLIDAGTRESCLTCSDTIRFPCAKVSDLAHVLCDTVRDLADLIGSAPGQLDKEVFAENLLRAIIKSGGSAKDKQLMLNEIWDCLEEHLTECLIPSWSLRGISHRFVKKIAVNRLNSILERVFDKEGYVCHRQ